MSDLFENHIVGFPNRRLNFDDKTDSLRAMIGLSQNSSFATSFSVVLFDFI